MNILGSAYSGKQSGTQLGKIKATLREQIHSGVIVQGQKLPSERELSELFRRPESPLRTL